MPRGTLPPPPPPPDPDPLSRPKGQPYPPPAPDPPPDPEPPDVPPERSDRPPPEPSPAAPAAGLTVYAGDFGAAEAERLLWRAGFGPGPGEAEGLAVQGLEAAVKSLTRPQGEAELAGPEPMVDGGPLRPAEVYGHDHLWWLDRMVRSTQPLVERMALIWHDWFATSNAGVGSQRLMVDQSDLFRRHALGSFRQLVLDVTTDPAMLLWQNGLWNTKWVPDENYARELMELFTLGAERSAYTEGDVREMARALTGWRADWSEELGPHSFRFDPNRHDAGQKTIFGQSGAFDWRDACRLCSDHPMHPSFVVGKLWSYFVADPPSPETQADLEALYLQEEHAIRPLVEAILMHPDLYLGARMAKPPVVHCAGLLRSQRLGISTERLWWYCEAAGQKLFYPPNVAGWKDESWLNTATLRARWWITSFALADRWIDPNSTTDTYSATESPDVALGKALQFWGDPAISGETWDVLLRFASSCLPVTTTADKEGPYRAMRQNALRHLIAASPDFQTC